MTLPKIELVGNLVADPELRFTPNGKAVASFRVACTDRGKDSDGNWVDKDTCFVSVSVWDKAAENVAETLTKGDSVIVTGALSQRSYDTRDGEKRTVYEVRAYAVGADLKRATAVINRVSRGQTPTGRATETDPWSVGVDDAPF